MEVFFSPEHFPLLLNLVNREIDRLKKLNSRRESDLFQSHIDSFIEIFNEIARSAPTSQDEFEKIYNKYSSADGLTADWYTILNAEHLVY